MGKADRRLRKKKERERKVARKKIRERQERLATGKKAGLEALQEAIRENLRARGGTTSPEADEQDSPLELERFRRYLWKAALKAGYDADHLTEGQEAELLEDWETKRDRLLAEDPVEEAHDIMLEAIEESDTADYDDWKSTLRVQQSLIQDALALDPDNIDALTLQGNHAFDLEEDEDATGFRLLNEAYFHGRYLDAALCLGRWDEEEPAREGYSDRDIDRGHAVGLTIGRAWRRVPRARSWLRESLPARDRSKG